jgi:hypothetical protein
MGMGWQVVVAKRLLLRLQRWFRCYVCEKKAPGAGRVYVPALSVLQAEGRRFDPGCLHYGLRYVW